MSEVLDHWRFFANGASDVSNRSHYYRLQIIQTARELGYLANLQVYRAWARMALCDTTQTEILISFHGIGREFQGVLSCSSLWFQRVVSEGVQREIGPVISLTDGVFLINYKEFLDEARERFSDWLDDAIVRSIKLWQETAL